MLTFSPGKITMHVTLHQIQKFHGEICVRVISRQCGILDRTAQRKRSATRTTRQKPQHCMKVQFDNVASDEETMDLRY